MPFIILDETGEPLLDIDGNMILVATKAEGRPFLMAGETIAEWEEWAAGGSA